MRNFYFEKDIEFIRTTYPICGAEYCAKHLNRTKCAIKTKAHLLGIVLNKNVNAEQFLNIKTEEVAYILGLLWADGNVSFANNKAKTPIIKHNSKPFDNIIFLEILNKTGKWNTFTSKNIGTFSKNINDICTNWISSRKIGEYLIENDYRNKKKSPNKIISKIPDSLKHLWFRGFFDGDGSVTIKPKGHHSIAFTGDKNQDWSFIVNLFKFLEIINFKIRVQSNTFGSWSHLRITNKCDLLKLEKYLYSDFDEHNLGLLRKRIQFKQL